jgi:exosortase A
MALSPQPSMAALLLIFIFSLFWFAGNLVVVNSVTQLSFVIMIALCIPAVLGWKITSIITFPIVFLIFAVPIGDFMLPIMMDWTADFTVIALRLTGIPVYREGLQFVIPSGRWSVVEACSGIRYLLASLTVGSLFAYLNYQNFFKRLIFILFSIIVPLIANWLRAYMIVLIGHYSGNELATGVDHLIYGWIFFGIIISLMLFLGMRWADSEDKVVTENKVNIKYSSMIYKNANFYKIYVYIFILVIFPHIADKLMGYTIRNLPVNISEMEPANPWKLKESFSENWKPVFSGYADEYNRFYKNTGEQEVGLHISYYRKQSYDRKLVTSTNSLIFGKNIGWKKLLNEKINLESIKSLPFVESTTINSEKNINKNIQIWKFYWIDEHFTSNNIYAKILGALGMIKGQGDDGAIIVIYTPFSESHLNIKTPEEANKVLKDFLKIHQQNIKTALLKTRNS